MLLAVLGKRLKNNVSVSPRGTDKDSSVLENDTVHFGTYVPTFRGVVTLPGITKRQRPDAAPLDGTYSPHVTVHNTSDLTRLRPQQF
jgi:hypothetical protein